MTERWILGSVGNVFLDRLNPNDAFAYAAPVLQAVDLPFGNCKGAYTWLL